MDGTEAQGSAAVVDEVEETTPDPKKAADPKAQKQGSSQPADKGKAKESGPPPWAKDLSDRGIDDPRVDEYLREVWQPRMTQHEQSLSEWEGLFGDGGMEAARIGAGLLDALESDPEGTYAQIGELLGLTQAEVESMVDEESDAGTEPADGEPTDPRQAYVDRLMQQEQEQKQEQQYQALLDALGKQFEGFDEDLFHICMLAHEGDLDQALQAYQTYHPEQTAGDPAPPTAGDASSPTPRDAPEYGSIGDSIDAFLSDERARRGK